MCGSAVVLLGGLDFTAGSRLGVGFEKIFDSKFENHVPFFSLDWVDTVDSRVKVYVYLHTITVRIKYSIRYEYLIRKQTEYWPFKNHFEFKSNPTPIQDRFYNIYRGRYVSWYTARKKLVLNRSCPVKP
jgi:hypothetical protein